MITETGINRNIDIGVGPVETTSMLHRKPDINALVYVGNYIDENSQLKKKRLKQEFQCFSVIYIQCKTESQICIKISFKDKKTHTFGQLTKDMLGC